MVKAVNLFDLINEADSLSNNGGGGLGPVGEGVLPENLVPINKAEPNGPLNPSNDVGQAAGAAYVNSTLPFVPSSLQAPFNAENTTNLDITTVTNLVNNQTIPSTGVITQDVTNLAASAENEYITFQVAQEGFGAYLQGILPEELAIAAGAFSATMQQVKNVLSVDFEKFAQVAFAMETTRGLDLINGTDVPTDVRLANEGYRLTALGSGPNGTYTMSDFFGSMSGLPYPWKDLYNGILDLQSPKLKQIYNQIYLGVTWEQATVTVNYSYEANQIGDTGPPDYTPIYEWRYRINSVTLTDAGGGYGRSAAPTPTGAFSGNGYYSTAGGATVNYSIGTDSENFTTYGRVIDLSSSPGSWVVYNPSTTNSTAPDPQIVYQIQAPPTAYTSYPYTGGTNTAYGTAGWPSTLNTTLYVNTTTPSLIKDANDEIATIRTLYPLRAINLNSLHSVTGSQLTIEQRARFSGIPPVPQGTRDRFLNPYPSSLMVFVDSIPELARNTLPHMQVQTLEAISNLDLTAGQSIVGAMREARNAERLDAIGVDQDNVIVGELSPEQELALLLNGTTISTLPNNVLATETDNAGLAGEPVPDVYSYPSNPESPFAVGFTRPAFSVNERNNVEVSPQPLGTFNGSEIIVTPNVTPGNPNVLLPIINNPNPNISGPGTGLGAGLGAGLGPKTGRGSALVGPNPNTLGKYGPVPFPNQPVQYPSVGALVPTGNGTPLDVGKAPLGSFAPSKAVNLLPPNLKFAAGTTLPSTFNVQEAIDNVIECNCDCWVQ